MNYQYIEQLLERYWECQTTLEEEQILRSFFSQPDIPEHLQQYISVFVYQVSQKRGGLGEEFDERMLTLIGDDTAVEAKKIKLSTRFAPLLKAAAVAAVALTIGNISEKALQTNPVDSSTVSTTDTYTKKKDITAKIKIIDQTKSEAMAKTDSLKDQSPTLTQKGMIYE